MKNLIILALFSSSIFLLFSCKSMIGDSSQTSDDVEEEPPNAMLKMEEEVRKLRLALSYQQTKDSFSDDEREAALKPQRMLLSALRCVSECNSDMLSLVGLDCGVSKEQAKNARDLIRSMACVPLKVNIPDPEERLEYLSAMEGYEKGKSQIVICYMDRGGEFTFHLNREGVEVVQ